jgi:type IV secretion system protein VirD4
LINQEGVYVGEWTNGSKIYTLRHNSPEHVLCYAPPRSGKGVGLVVPTMLTWPHSAVVTDLKREIYELTAGWRGTQGEEWTGNASSAAENKLAAFCLYTG